jgi:hypothetical protein
MNTLKQRITSNWHITRVIRLILGVCMLVWSIQMLDWTLGLLSLLFIGMAISNTGCCGAQACAVPYKPERNNIEEIKEQENEHSTQLPG